ncbi:MAG TPA: hypothetical protein VG269_00385 [Tepidisphaeraceae bacterium]|jgi:hypothetical protein|nr:hypothetical protein [Tepidisphaeraceae bacterium]
MNPYETTATVEDHGQVRVAGVPFEPGTEVEVVISPKARSADDAARSDEQAWAAAHLRIRELLRTAKGFRNSPRIPREELYERGRVS